jgi:hypothetical protein
MEIKINLGTSGTKLTCEALDETHYCTSYNTLSKNLKRIIEKYAQLEPEELKEQEEEEKSSTRSL